MCSLSPTYCDSSSYLERETASESKRKEITIIGTVTFWWTIWRMLLLVPVPFRHGSRQKQELTKLYVVWIVSPCLNPSFISVSDFFLRTEFKDQDLDDPILVSGPDPYQQHMISLLHRFNGPINHWFLGPFTNVWFSWAHTILIFVGPNLKWITDRWFVQGLQA